MSKTRAAAERAEVTNMGEAREAKGRSPPSLQAPGQIAGRQTSVFLTTPAGGRRSFSPEYSAPR